MIMILDCGSQLSQNIARRVREMGVFASIVPFSTPLREVLAEKPGGLIISGGPFSVYDEGAPLYDRALLETGLPVLGICYGLQSMIHLLGGKVRPTAQREYGKTKIDVIRPGAVFEGVRGERFPVWMSHGDVVETLPDGFEVLARSSAGHIAAVQRGKLCAVQFHPEVDHTTHGRTVLDNFLRLCVAARDWDPSKEFDRVVERTRDQVQGKVGIGGVSGGVDSTALAVMLGRMAGRDFHPIFVDNGLLRENEAREVRASLEAFDLDTSFIDASTRFLDRLEGVVDPDEKRKRIGYEFISVFEEAARETPGVTYLAQGTLYPDVIESTPVYGSSSEIKRHHNVGGLPERMDLELVEPFRHLFKDEVRAIAEQRLGLPPEIVWRHPCPGPGLAVRIIGDVTPEKLSILRRADAIFVEELRQRGLYREIGQAFAVLTGVQSVGVMGDAGTYEAVVALRAVTTRDFMTADWFDFAPRDLREISNRIINEVRGVNRVVYDISQKPPSTIEWE